MASQVGTIEDTIIQIATQTMQGRVKTVEWAPPDWDEDFAKRTLVKLPGVFIVFAGGQRTNKGSHSILLNSNWLVVAVTRHVQDAKKRARGDALEIGCYEILETLIPKLDGLVIENVGTLEFIDWNNDIALKLEDQALMTQSALFEMPIQIEKKLNPSDLVPFRRFYDAFDIGQPPDAPETKDQVELPQ